MNGRKKSKGFTIIEVMIVLAIASLIIAIILYAVPALQRNARNNERKNDATHLAGLVHEYASNHLGQLPASVCSSGSCSAADLDVTNEHWAIMNRPASSNIITAPNSAWGSITD